MRPDLARTFRPGLVEVPLADEVMLEICRSSTAMRSLPCALASLMISVVTLCLKSCLRVLRRSYSSARVSRALR